MIGARKARENNYVTLRIKNMKPLPYQIEELDTDGTL